MQEGKEAMVSRGTAKGNEDDASQRDAGTYVKEN